MSDPSRLILITARFEESQLNGFRAVSSALRVEQQSTREPETIDPTLWQETEILYTYGSLPMPEQAPHLRWVQLHSAGIDHILDHPLFQAPVRFTTTSGIHAINMAEYVFTMILSWYHRVPRMIEWQRRGKWPPDRQRFPLFVPQELWGKRIGIVGYGSIGRQVARLAKGFGMEVLAMQRGEARRYRGFPFQNVGDPEGTLPDRFFPPEALHELLGESDVVVLALPLTPATHGLLDRAAFEAMRPGAFLVNVARGAVCDETALLEALRKERIAGAALDVFAEEPLPASHPFWELPNLLLSPHVSGFTPEYDSRAATIFEENLRRYLAGEPLYNEVDKGLGY